MCLQDRWGSYLLGVRVREVRAETFEREVVGSVRARWPQKHRRFLGIDVGFR